MFRGQITGLYRQRVGPLVFGVACVALRPLEPKGRDGIFFMLPPLINKHLHNAIAHGDIQLDAQNAKVLYSNQSEGRVVYSEMDLLEFVGLGTYLFSRLPALYLGVLSTILVFETGSIEQRLRLPAFNVEKISGATLPSA